MVEALPQEYIDALVRQALDEDIGTGDLSGALIPQRQVDGWIIAREDAVLCGADFVETAFRILDADVSLQWHARDGDWLTAEQRLVDIRGDARALLTVERTALNFLQMLSATATTAQHWAAAAQPSKVRILDTRKTVPGLRLAQKYAVHKGGCYNHRIGLYDAFLLKENHIAACGGITACVEAARRAHPDKPVQVEVENSAELQEALAQQVPWILLDNFTPQQCAQAVSSTAGRAVLEASGNIDLDTLAAYAKTGVDYISTGALTKNICAIDFSMRVSL